MRTKQPKKQRRILKIKHLAAAHKGLLVVSAIVLAGVLGFVGYSAWLQLSANAGDERSLASLSPQQRQYAVPLEAEKGCFLAGRVWKDGVCKRECRADGVKFVNPAGAVRGYCQGYVGLNIDPAQCVRDLHRYYILETGCARRTGGDSANDARQCIPGYPNYLNRDGQDRCVIRDVEGNKPGPTPTPTPTPPSTPNPPAPAPPPSPTPVAPPKTDTAKDCKLLGREWNSKDKRCKAVCMAGTGALAVGARSGVKYCEKAIGVTKNGTEVNCTQTLHRVWLVEGCARRADQKDATRGPKEPLIQCLPTYNYYNANFNDKAEDKETLRDVCELNKATANLNEQAGTPGQQQTIPRDPDLPGGGHDTPNNPDNPNGPNLPADDEYKIIVYTERNFQGASLVIKGDMSELQNGWNDNIESYKIISGRWQLCEDTAYQTNCMKPWASDPDMRVPRKDDGKKRDEGAQKTLDDENRRSTLSNRVSSLRRVLLKTFEDTAEDISPACLTADGSETLALEDGDCPAGSTLTCPDGLVLKNRECKQVVLSPSLIVPVDKSFKKDKNGERDCHLLGREWIGQPEDGEADNGGNYGCSVVTCRFERDGRPKKVAYNAQDRDQKVTDTFCVSYKHDAPYAVKLDKDPKASKKKCDERHRVWIQQVRLCAQVPNRKDRNQTIVNAEQCKGGDRVYYIFKETTKMDECFTKNVFENAQGVVKSVGGALEKALRQGPKAYCNSVKKGNYHWNGEKCVIDRKTCWNGKSIPVTGKCPVRPTPQNNTGDGGNEGNDGDSTPAAVNCAALGRPQAGPYNCARSCTNSNLELTNYPDNRWDKCVPKDNGCREGGCGPVGGPDTYYRTYSQARAEGVNMGQFGYPPDQCNPGTYAYNIGIRLRKPFRISNYFGSGKTLVITDGVCIP